MIRTTITILLLMVAVLSGCASSKRSAEKSEPGEYRTVAEDPNRNTNLAKEENARGVDLLDAGKLADAETSLKRALTSDVMYGPAHNNLGKVYYQQGRFYLAAWEFQYAAKLMPNRPEPLNNLGLVFEAVGKLDDAVANYSKALASEPDNANYIGNSARARLRRGDKDEEVRGLLNDLVLKDTRPEWVAWARQRLASLRAE